MYYPKQFNLGDIVETKKKHPCGSSQWEVIRVGADFKIKCLGCSRIVMLPRPKFEKSVKKVIKSAVPEENNID
ncbi:MAG: DUF951 domain-containing protein [Clostridiaceae bacterium]|jgi:hypothetical protein|nr:DUF951 domain-containing protein [Clostridiaceae bacterium]